MFDTLRCQLRQFDTAWKSGLIIVAVVLVITIISRLTITLDIDQDPILRKRIVEMLQHITTNVQQAEQDSRPAFALAHISTAKGYLLAALSLASADQIFKTTSVNVGDLSIQLNQREQLLLAKISA